MKFFALLIALCIPEILFAQKSFVLKTGLDISLGSLGIGGLTLDKFYFEKHHEILSAENFSALKNTNLFFTDQPRKEFMIPGKFSDVLLISALAPAGFYLINKNYRGEYGTYLTMYLETMMLNVAITDIIKATANRSRPYVYTFTSYDEVLKSKSPEEATLSFYSGHTSTVAASSFFLARTITLNETDKMKKTFIWISAATIPAIQGLLRVSAGKHFVSDVIVGYAMGALTGYIIPSLHIKK